MPLPQDTGALAGDRDVKDAMQTLSRLGSDLLESYETLSRRAAHVEDELCRANAELERKVGELDAVSRDLAAILDALPTGVVVRDAAGRVLRVNDAALEILGSTEHELLANDLGARAEAEATAGGWQQSEVLVAGGERRVLATRQSAIARGAARGPTGTVQILDDRTELVELTERLHRLDKLAALGNMAGGIAHEIRNPMNGIKGFAALLAARLEHGTREREWAGLIVEGVSEAERILSSMLTLARPDGLVAEEIDPARLVDDAVALALADFGGVGGPDATARWEVATECSAAPFAGDRIKLRQALRNLIANALDAQPEGGALRVSIRTDSQDVEVRVSDGGPGVPAELRRRILEPFFTTRADGTGLGLALVSKIAQLHGGSLDLAPSPGPLGGAEFLIRFPTRTAA